ncbi:MAG: serine/threonine protein kinase [Desulfurococcales archaeon]|nr:serine/threonine protein kinase [Desulfurococcales archaeon]
MASRLQRIIDSLDRVDVRILRVIETQLSRYYYVPLEVIERKAGIPGSRLGKSLLKLTSMKLVKRSLGSSSGYTLTYLGLDVLALWSLIRRGVLVRVGERIGVGKEGDVYLVEMPGGGLAVAKLHREGRTSFSKIKRVRSSVAFIDRKQWFRIAKLLGEREFKVLVRLHEKGAWVPEPIALDRHCVVQEYREGVELYRVRELPVDEAHTLLRGLLETLRIAYTSVGVVHGDLSEYNVLYEGGGRGVIIDWPQYVYREEDGAEELLLRDIRYLTSYFRRRFGIDIDIEDALGYVRGVKSAPP